MKKREKEMIAVGCVVGLCGFFSEGCMVARWMLAKLSGFFHGRGEERRLEGALGGQ